MISKSQYQIQEKVDKCITIILRITTWIFMVPIRYMAIYSIYFLFFIKAICCNLYKSISNYSKN